MSALLAAALAGVALIPAASGDTPTAGLAPTVITTQSSVTAAQSYREAGRATRGAATVVTAKYHRPKTRGTSVATFTARYAANRR